MTGSEPSDAAADVELKDGQTATTPLGLDVTVTWGAFDTNGHTGDGPHEKGCTWVKISAKNTTSTDFLATREMGGNGELPNLSFSMEAGDTLRSASVLLTGADDDWPNRIKAGKTETWKQCFMAEEREQHLTLSLSDSNAAGMKLARWVRA